jgi:ATP-dependent helicase HrpB
VLPVASIQAQLIGQLQSNDVILVAPPGAGKSTYLPLRLLEAQQFQGQKIIMLQPRRIAVRAIAEYLARQLGEDVGQTVGYRIRGEAKVSANTRLEIVTEGILSRQLMSNAELPGVALIIFDEFHERNLHCDFSLALCLEIQQALRDDLRLLVMSATLHVSPLQALMPQAQLLHSEGRAYPVEVHYQSLGRQQKLQDALLQLIYRALDEQQGSILVFLPGSWDITNLAQSLAPLVSDSLLVCPLYGELNKQQQLAAIAPSSPGQRKIVLATNIAETSLTIDGINTVIDSGLEKVAIFNLSKGITELKQQAISQSSATQRAGRAGRLGPGTCYRLWAKEGHERLVRHSQPQILHSDICAMMLDAAAWGSSVNQLSLLDQPSSAQLSQAQGLLQNLAALDKVGKITIQGRALSQLACHPRLANMLIAATQFGQAEQYLACLLASLLEDKDVLPRSSGVSLRARVHYLQGKPGHAMWKMVSLWQRRIGLPSRSQQQSLPEHNCGLLIALAFPDKIAKSRGNGRFLLADGTGAFMAEDDPLAHAPYLVIAQLMLVNNQADARITYAEDIQLEEIQSHLPHLIQQQEQCQWQQAEQKIVARQQTMLGAICLHSQTSKQIDGDKIQQLWCEIIRKRGLEALPLCDKSLNLLLRMRLAKSLFAGNKGEQSLWPDLSESWLEQNIEVWLAPYLTDIRNWAELSKLDWLAIIKNNLDWSQQTYLEQLLPGHITVPSGSKIALQYHQDGTVSLAVRMQEVYGLADTPTLAQGKVKVVMDLLSPAHRPIQKTQDLAGFWAGSYKQVQKEMKGRYPRHFWPDDPATATATSKTKKKMLMEQKQQEQEQEQ